MSGHNSLSQLSAAAMRFLSQGQHGLLIDGQTVPAVSGQLLEIRDPSTGVGCGHLAAGGEEDIDRAVRAARLAFEGPWSSWTPYERQALLYRVHEVIDRNFSELAEIESVDMGAPISRTRATKAAVLKMILFFASQSSNIAGETLQNGLPGEVATMTLKAPVGV
ncbi:aldehyde dehydrogenase family protein, partial [Paraburkholderia sp. JHI869]|uniref:aldehyde dehydrogenase family protein n=1 Tax=Paraburkholderia sp. JHI869 TaxID=3112959 RepID=UPI00317EED52